MAVLGGRAPEARARPAPLRARAAGRAQARRGRAAGHLPAAVPPGPRARVRRGGHPDRARHPGRRRQCLLGSRDILRASCLWAEWLRPSKRARPQRPASLLSGLRAARQVVRWSHWLLGHAAAWQRDDMRLRDLLPRVATLPLGSGPRPPPAPTARPAPPRTLPAPPRRRRALHGAAGGCGRPGAAARAATPPGAGSGSPDQNPVVPHPRLVPGDGRASGVCGERRRAGGQPLRRGPAGNRGRPGHGRRRVPQLHGRRVGPRLRVRGARPPRPWPHVIKLRKIVL